MKKILISLLFIASTLALVLVIIPSPIDSVAYQAPTAPPAEGVLTPNTDLLDADLLALGKIDGPEDVAVDLLGRVYGGTQDGKIVRLVEGEPELFVDLTVSGEKKARPLGLHFDQQGNLIVCDAWQGLLSIDPTGTVTVLSTEAEGVPFAFADDLDIASNGIIYFSDASSRFNQPDYALDLLEARPWGRLLAYDPATGKTTVLMHDLYFANGIALSTKEDFVLVNETYRYRIQRYWLSGPKAGTHDLFIDNLPGLPDGVSGNRKGTFWVALATPRKDSVDQMHKTPWLKDLIAKLPPFLWPKPERYGYVLALNEQGEIVRSLHDPQGNHLEMVTSAEEHQGHLYLGSLHNDRIGRLALQ
ncbi:SMP-30/gluconolactonase/LRE family protein [Aestuariirhabdus sp. Z084]|uniref:SMP-30/gluconolactonase/LRE family protein n=1 Tax=Aestuariirhabdus haliotis TaxID=2918751 RepID=UPI00201B374C|nr:SMP-30/gluconolactonase/LRE family protein [Aestuariirhabdus haliotis]MCL6416903.1 SMP-30/gluconolactonase/LRE family protein [Aestuariirhabdus haliotis]MCL6420878.1 SMP-30/gluconolactonase/LRE family protein [Aestuariirhabdus haliotis]